ncbi:hypothetical protein BO78DRAFT_35833 [Aspergillus sclerotiicarbonarius CBS 121057]|uniref:Uncharacterized protein n=1 Tax=Aspergillus sclerotiicarbonarius (strain CBS 121057 / IBT 28362) TaxID=1448318 RepID=A0A319EAG8_ASPSB|nr:hypothetical protein BO78DRAFT_35833 [Aspergillus sclerotiicarbonarius CBS 121057]
MFGKVSAGSVEIDQRFHHRQELQTGTCYIWIMIRRHHITVLDSHSQLVVVLLFFLFSFILFPPCVLPLLFSPKKI